MTRRHPRWDDWRCYRCNRWQKSSAAHHPHVTPAGIVVSMCAECAKAAAEDAKKSS